MESSGDSSERGTTVVNVRVAHIRRKGYENLQEWVDDPSNIYIGRAGPIFINGKRFPPQSSIWANPFKISKKDSRTDVILMYREYIREKIVREGLEEELLQLRGYNLGCWCVSEDWRPTDETLNTCDEDLVCHGQILCQLIAEYGHK